LRHRGELFAERLHDFRHAAFAAGQQLQQAQARSIAESTEDPTRAIEGFGTRRTPLADGMVRDLAMNMYRHWAPYFFAISLSSKMIELARCPVNRNIGIFHKKRK
jgi:hypothetical protein